MTISIFRFQILIEAFELPTPNDHQPIQVVAIRPNPSQTNQVLSLTTTNLFKMIDVLTISYFKT